jgi:hypothetical protein
MDENEIAEAIKKAEAVLGKVNLNWSSESTATAGIGYAILALTKVVQAALVKREKE